MVNHPLYGSYAEFKGNTFDEYEYQDDNLVSIKSIWVYGSTVQNPTYFPQFDVFGNLSLLTRVDEPSNFFPDGQNIIIFEKNRYSLKALTDILIKEYVEILLDQIYQQKNKNVLILTIEYAFSSDDWLPPKFYFFDLDISMKENQLIDDWINSDKVNFSFLNEFNQRILDASRLLEQEIVINKKYSLPNQILFKIAKTLHSKLSQSESNQNLLIIPLDLPDDYGTEVVQILKRVYNAKEIRAITNTNNTSRS